MSNTKTLVAVLAHQEYNDMVARHWPWYRKSGCDILGVGREDKPVTWPVSPGDDGFVGSVGLGESSRAYRDNHLDRLLRVLELFVETEYSDCCIIEADAIFLKPLPAHPGNCIVTTLGGYGGEGGFAPCRFWHTPWWMDKGTAQDVIEYGRRMLKMKIFEGGFVDRWLGLMVELYQLPVTPALSFSVNTLDSEEYLTAARIAVIRGAYYVHGIKTEYQLKRVTA